MSRVTMQELNKSVETSNQLHGSEGKITDDVQNQSMHVTSPGVESTDQSPANESNLANQVETPTFGSNQFATLALKNTCSSRGCHVVLNVNIADIADMISDCIYL